MTQGGAVGLARRRPVIRLPLTAREERGGGDDDGRPRYRADGGQRVALRAALVSSASASVRPSASDQTSGSTSGQANSPKSRLS